MAAWETERGEAGLKPKAECGRQLKSHSYSLKGQMFVHVPHTQRYCAVTAEVCKFSQMEHLCIESQVNEEDQAGMQQHHSCSWPPQLLLVNS